MKQQRRRVFALSKNIFLRNRSLNTLGGFGAKKKANIGKGNLYLTENRFSRNECGVRLIITIIKIVCHILC